MSRFHLWAENGRVYGGRRRSNKGMTDTIHVQVKSKWQGKVAVRDKYVQEAIRYGKALAIEHAGGLMVIPAGTIEQAIKGKSDRAFFDKFSKQNHWLFYFDWRPSIQQAELI